MFNPVTVTPSILLIAGGILVSVILVLSLKLKNKKDQYNTLAEDCKLLKKELATEKELFLKEQNRFYEVLTEVGNYLWDKVARPELSDFVKAWKLLPKQFLGESTRNPNRAQTTVPAHLARSLTKVLRLFCVMGHEKRLKEANKHIFEAVQHMKKLPGYEKRPWDKLQPAFVLIGVGDNGGRVELGWPGLHPLAPFQSSFAQKVE